MPLKDLLQQVIQGSSYQRPDVLTDKAKRLARRAYVSPTPSRLQTNVRNLAPVQQQAILRPQAPKLKVNQFNRALNTGPGRLGLGVLKGMDELNPVRGALPGLAAASDASVNDQSLQNSLLFQGGKLGTQLAGNALMYGKAFQAATKLPVVGAKITAGLKGLNAAGGAKALAGKAIGAYAVGDPLIGALRGGSTALGQRQNVLAGAGKGVIEELTFPAQAAINIPTALKVMGSKDATPMEKVQAGLGAGLSVLALLPIMPGLSDAKMAKVIPDQYKKHMDVLRRADDTMKKAVPEKMYGKFFTDDTMKDPVKFLQGLNDTGSLKKAMQEMIGEGKLSVDDAVDLYKQLDIDLSKMEGVAPGGRFSGDIEALRAPVDATVGAKATIPPELEPLAKEAAKYANAEDFIDSIKDTKITGQAYQPRGVEAALRMRAEDPNGDLSNYDVKAQAEWLGNTPPKDNNIVLYRATPNGIGIKPGDYVTNDIEYAKDHIKNNLGGKGSVTKIQAKLEDIYPADGPKEFWYSPKNLRENLTDLYNQVRGQSQGELPVTKEYDELLNKKIKLQNELKKVPDTYDNTNKLLRLKSDLAEVEIGMANIRDAAGSTGSIKQGQETLRPQKSNPQDIYGASRADTLSQVKSEEQRINVEPGRLASESKNPSKSIIAPIEINPETGRVENRYVTEARKRIAEIDGALSNERASIEAKKMIVQDVRSRFSDSDMRLLNKVRRLANTERYSRGDVDSLLLSNSQRDVKMALERVKEAMNIETDDDAFQFIKDFPSIRSVDTTGVTRLLDEKRALNEFISDANKQSASFVPIRKNIEKISERAVNDFKEWQAQVFKQEGAVSRTQLDSAKIKEIEGLIKTNTKPAYLKDVTQLKDISNPGKGMTDVYRHFDQVFGKDSLAKKQILDPFDTSKAKMVDEIDSMGSKLEADIIKGLGIKPKSSESAAVQQYGEKLRDYDSLVKEFGKDGAENIVKADKWFRGQYDRLLSEVNAVRARIYPNNPEMQIPRRQDYYRHFTDLSDTFSGLKSMFETPSGIDPALAGVSDFTTPRSKWLSFAQKRLGVRTEYDAVSGFIDYANAQAYAKNIDPHIGKFRALRDELVNATGDNTRPGYGKLNNFIEFLNDYANDLAGKTNPADRAVQKYTGRGVFRVINWVNSRTKANVILGNLSSMIAQFFNIPQGVAEAGPINSARGGVRALASILDEDPVMAKSEFIKTRYADNLASKFDPTMLGKAKRMAGWVTQIGDEIGTKFIWNSLYEQAIKDGVENPVKYADDVTRKMVAGRGIGEVPLLQKSKTFQLIAPFQIEVANVWHVMREWAGEKAANKFVTFFVASYVMNRLAKEVRGSDVSFDPVNAMVEAANTMEEEENKGRGALMATGRLLGEVLSNLPLGQNIASIYPEYGGQIGGTKLPTREQFFGEGDPTRFGSGALFTRGLTDPYAILPPFGGQQLKRSVQGVQSWLRGYDESASGKIRMPIEQSPINLIKSATFGKYSTKDARDYFDNDRSVLGEKQSETFKRIYKTQGPEAAKRYYDSIIKKREAEGTSGTLRGASGGGGIVAPASGGFTGGVLATGLQGTPKKKKGRAGRRPSPKATPKFVITKPKSARTKFRVIRRKAMGPVAVRTKDMPVFRIVRNQG